MNMQLVTGKNCSYGCAYDSAQVQYLLDNHQSSAVLLQGRGNCQVF